MLRAAQKKLQGVLGLAAVAALVFYTTSAKAGTVFSENFDTGSATFTVNDPYWTNQSLANGYIIEM